MPKRYYPKSKTSPKDRRRRFKPKISTIRASAEASLKRVFTRIGIPEPGEFVPDDFQLEALDAIEKKADCLVTAPTGAGKTWIATQAIERFIKKGGKAWYASPLKALSNSKYAEFQSLFGPENVGILTGDRKEYPEASVIVGTTEILRNQLYDAMHHGDQLGTDLVILDEAHYLGDEDRGVVWEEIMIYLPVRIPILMLSATIGNAVQIADWLHSIRGRACRVVEETRRPVPLFHLFFHPSGRLLPLLAGKPEDGKKTKVNNKVREYINDKDPKVLAPPRQLPPMGDVLNAMKQYNLLPAIFFLKSRSDCDKAIEMCGDNFHEDPEKGARLRERLHELVSQSSHISGHKQLHYVEQNAVGAHHSGRLPAWKMVIEQLMTEGLLDAVFATSTVAAGVNFPARTVVFLNSDRYNGREFLPLSPTEFHQMTGRAGRRGMDNIGFSMILPGKFMDVQWMAKLSTSLPAYVISRIKIDFSMVLNLLLSNDPVEIEDLLKRSFAEYLIKGKKKRSTQKLLGYDQRNLWNEFLRHLDFLKQTGYVDEDDKLTEDGVWASQLRVDQPLMIAEGFKRQLFPESDPALLAGIIASFVNENETDDRIEKRLLPRHLFKTMLQVKKGMMSFEKHLNHMGFETRQLFLRPAASIYAWASGSPWEKALEIAETAEGDFAMLILRTADNLRHIRSLADVFPRAAKTAGEAVDLMLRDPVIALFEG